ncbi:MipA/OmpV family protein [Rheinheimera baltica]|nr:MipA/OmpV family protein [Rheinheimera baltica]MDP5142427.1 MipA/OmpV family protein [Rheinheimera baltica]MDP5150670.1 MipA/OmpV family protein [Rheinheimera baltica]
MAAKADTAEVCLDDPGCATEQKLYLSLALGYGQRSNPLYDGEELPLILLPEVYYYGENWFFDNGKLGTSWALSEQWHLSLVSQLNSEKGYFQKWFGGNVFQFSQSFTNASISEERIGPMQASVHEISKRPTAVDAGLQLDWFSDNWQVQSNVWQDISNTYQGQHASISVGRYWENAFGRWQFIAKLNWKSAKLIDTYYGIDNNDPFYLRRYNGKPSWQPELRLSWQHPLSERFAVLGFLRYLHLDDAMTDSPLLRTNNITTWFFGVSYRLF